MPITRSGRIFDIGDLPERNAKAWLSPTEYDSHLIQILANPRGGELVTSHPEMSVFTWDFETSASSKPVRVRYTYISPYKNWKVRIVGLEIVSANPVHDTPVGRTDRVIELLTAIANLLTALVKKIPW